MPNPTPNQAGLTPGGKSLTGGNAHSPMLNVRVPASWKTELDRQSREQGIGTSKLVRKIIGDYLNAQK